MSSLAVYSLAETIVVDTTSSNGVVTVIQESGTTASVSNNAGVFKIVRPVAHVDVLTFRVEAKADGPLVSMVFEVPPISTMPELVFDGSVASNFSHWH